MAWLERPYADYCRELAALKGLPEPAARDWQALEAAGWKRLAMVRNLELVRALFRRPLELWLLLDRCLYLVEQGYSVRLGEFCPTSLSPAKPADPCGAQLIRVFRMVAHTTCG